MDITVDQAVAVLSEQLELLDVQATELEEKLATIKENRKRYKTAVAALQGGKSRSNGKPPQKRCAKKRDVIAIMERLLQDNGPMPVTDLRELAQSNVTEKGWSQSGFAMRFAEALRCEQFAEANQVVSLFSAVKKASD